MLPTILLAIGFINGLTLGGVLLSLKSAKPKQTRLFAWIVILFSLIIGQEFIEILNVHFLFPHILSSTDGLVLLIFPLLYLYMLFITGKRTELKWNDLFHIVPFLIISISMLPYFALNGEIKLKTPTNFEWMGYFKAVVMIIYFFLIGRGINKAYRHQKNNSALKWFRRFILSLMVIGVFTLVHFALENQGFQFYLNSDALSGILLAIIIYSYSFLLIKKPQIIWGNIMSQTQGVNNSKIDPIRYRNSPLSEIEQKQYLDKLISIMKTEKPFLDPNLTALQLSNISNIKPHYVSQIINEKLGQNFYEFVNTFRVEEVKRLMLEPDQEFKTLLALGLESGFNSKSSFNRVFKQQTGLTPTQYKKRISQQ